MKKTISLGVIGCGARTELIIRKTVDAGPGVKLVAACDPLPGQAEKFRDKFNPELALYKDEESFFAHPGLDWVMIGSPNRYHYAHIEAAFRKGLDVYCEKPLATTPQDIAAILSFGRKSKERLMIGFTLRYSPFYRKLKALLEQGSIGRLVSFEFNETLEFNHGGHIMRDWRRRTVNSGGHMLEKCCHDMDIANWLVGALPVSVASFGGREFFKPESARHMDRIGTNSAGKKGYCTWTHPEGLANPFTGDCDIIDNQVAILEYGNRVRATFHTNLNAGIQERRMYLLGTEGAIRADVLTGRIEVKKVGFDTKPEIIEMADCASGHGGGDDVLVDCFRKMMLEGAASLTPVTDGASSAVVCLSLDQAMRENRIVDLRPQWKTLGFDPESNAPQLN